MFNYYITVGMPDGKSVHVHCTYDFFISDCSPIYWQEICTLLGLVLRFKQFRLLLVLTKKIYIQIK